jgi:hypothetical protein
MMKASVLALALAASAGSALAQFTITTGVSPTYASNGLFNSTANGLLPYTYSGSAFPISSYSISGRLTRAGTSSSLPAESRIGVDIPGGAKSTVNSALFSGTFPTSGVVLGNNITRRATGGLSQQAGTGNQMQILSAPAVFQPGSGNFRFFETVDDGGEAQIDARWSNLSITVNRVVAPTANVTDLGTIGFDGAQVVGTTSAAAPVQWYRFVVPANATVNSGRWFDITTRASGAAFDTSLALFRGSDGALLSADDEDGTGSFSQLSYGSTSVTPFTGASAGNRGSGAIYAGSTSAGGNHGRDFALDAGEYYLAVGFYTSAFNGAGDAIVASEGFGINTNLGTFGNYTLNLTTNIPTPGALALVGLGGLVAARRRRA